MTLLLVLECRLSVVVIGELGGSPLEALLLHVLKEVFAFAALFWQHDLDVN